MKNKLLEIYDKHYRALQLIPTILIILAALVIGYTYYTTGDFVHKGVSLKGGSTITITQAIDVSSLESYLTSQFPKGDITVRSLTSAGSVIGISIESDAQSTSEIKVITSVLESKFNLKKEDYGVEVMGSALGQAFFKQAFYALLIAFLLMAIVVFISFRNIIPSLAVLAAAASDLFVTLAIFNLTGLKLNTGGIAAFLMLIGYSIDTDILLTSRVLKRKEGTVFERVVSAMKTGLTMTATTLSAVIVALIFIKSDIIKQIMLILLIGLIVDMIMTWIQNVSILRVYLEHKQK